MLTVELLDRDKLPVSSRLSFAVQSYSSDAIGGPVAAAITAAGPDAALALLRAMLGYYVTIRNENNEPVWWGMLEGVTVEIGGISVGVSLRDFRNRIKVAYTIIDGEGFAQVVETGWVEHERSVGLYGRRELTYAAGEMSATGAAQLAARELEKLGLPRQAIDLSRSTTGGATLRCAGLWSTLAWTYYGNEAGREVYEAPTNAEQVLGWGFTASDVGFADRAMHRLSGGLGGAVAGDAIRVTGSASNNASYTVEARAEGTVTAYTATTIAFDPIDDILDDAGLGLGFVREGTFVSIVGSTANSGYHLVNGRGRNHITVDTAFGGTIDAEAAGPSITISQGQSLGLSVDVTTEGFGNSITVRSYDKIGFTWTPTHDLATWKAAELWIKARKVGDPADSLRVNIQLNSSGTPSTILDYQIIDADDLLHTSAWVKFELNRVADIAHGTTYWVTVERTGANNANNYYAIGLDEDQLRAGTLKLYNGSAWVDRPVAASMPFQVWGATQTSAQMAVILANEGQFLEGYSVRTTSGIYSRQYRAGNIDALYELDKLVASGTDDGNALLAMVNPDWHAVIYEHPTNYDDPQVILRRGRDGARLTTGHGEPLAEGVLPVGQWCAVDGVTDDVEGLAPMSPFLISYLEYNAQQGRITNLRAFGSESVFNFALIAQG